MTKSEDNKFVRQLIEKVIVESKERIKAIFKGGLEVEESLSISKII